MQTYEERKKNYEEKRERKIERAEELADKHREKAQEKYKAFRAIGDHIPMGQPILVGHHSERRHRRDLERMENNIRKSAEHDEIASKYEQKAESMRENRAIFSDDPDVINKLETKVEILERYRDEMKFINAQYRKGIAIDDIETSDKMKAAAKSNIECWRGGPPFPSYSLTNLGARIREAKKRSERIEKANSFEGFTVDDIECKAEDGYIKLFFPAKPCENFRNTLKRSPFSFKWSSYQKAWVRKNTGFADWYIEKIKELCATFEAEK